jgi:hypothetical protein
MDHGPGQQVEMSIDLMHQINQRAVGEGEKIYYSRTGKVTYIPVPETHFVFKSARRDATRSKLEILRLLVCNKTAVKEPKRGVQYFTPLSHKRRKAKYFEILATANTIYEIGARWKICKVDGSPWR